MNDGMAVELTGAGGEKWECLGDIAPTQNIDLNGWRNCPIDCPDKSPVVHGSIWADGDRPWYQVPGHSLSGLPLSSGRTFERIDYE